MKKERKNYCGPFWMPPYLKKILSNTFNASCKIHDLDYSSKRFSRKEADKRFLKHMLRQSYSFKCVLIAYIYYFCVRFAGKLSWRKNG